MRDAQIRRREVCARTRALDKREALEDELRELSGGCVIQLDEAGEAVESPALGLFKAGEHDRFDEVWLLDEAVDGAPLQPAPLPAEITGAEDDDDEIGLAMIELGQIPGEIGLRKLGLVILVVENLVLAQLLREDVGDLRHERPMNSRKGEGDAEAFGRHGGKECRTQAKGSDLARGKSVGDVFSDQEEVGKCCEVDSRRRGKG